MAEEWQLRARRLWGTTGESEETEGRSVFIGFAENFGEACSEQRLLEESENRGGSSPLAARGGRCRPEVCVRIFPPAIGQVGRQPARLPSSALEFGVHPPFSHEAVRNNRYIIVKNKQIK